MEEKIDMAGNMRDFFQFANQFKQQYQMMRQDPRRYFADNYNINIPDDVDVSDSNAITQYMLNNGHKTQQEYNKLQSVRNNPIFQMMFNMR